MDPYLEYAKENKKIIIANLTKDSQPDDEKDAIFMAGSPGAGKSEVALGLVNSYHKHLIIDADEFRSQFPEYNGSNSSLFQKASSWLVDQSFKYVINHGYSFILDATFAILSAEKNITRALKNGYNTTIFYIYQDPVIAWQFTKARELKEGRKVPKETFIHAFFQSRINIEKVKTRYPDVTLHIIVKDYQNNISEVHYDADNIQLIIPQIYTKDSLERMLES